MAGVMCGITPVWSSEIELFPLRVTAARFPEMEQLGSVTDINGAEIEPVDIITFGSPCQDLSVAGKQLGIHEGQRSNLFFEAVRIIKEMRAADERIGRTGKHIRPRFAVWENVPGAFSSNKGADFKAVLEALAGVCEDGVDVPQPKRWNTGGGILGNGWSIAWRVYDAQYWGVPQRRKRIYLVADFASERAPEILFEREGVRGDTAESGTAREGTAADVEGGAGGSCIAFKERAGKPGGGKGILPAVGRAFTLATNVDQSVVYEPKSLMEENWAESTVKNALRANASKSGHCVVQDNVKCLNPWDYQSKRQHDIGGAYPTLQAYNGGGGRCDGVCYAIDCRNMTGNAELSATLQAKNEGGFSLNFVNPVVYENSTGDGISPTITASYYKGPGTRNGEERELIAEEVAQPPRKYIVRRLTPTECARLQGFPDDWCEGLGGSDSAIYKAYGNGLALPCAYDVLRRIAKEANCE